MDAAPRSVRRGAAQVGLSEPPKCSGPARGPQRVSMRGGDGVPWPAAGADFFGVFIFFRDFLLVTAQDKSKKGG